MAGSRTVEVLYPVSRVQVEDVGFAEVTLAAHALSAMMHAVLPLVNADGDRVGTATVDKYRDAPEGVYLTLQLWVDAEQPQPEPPKPGTCYNCGGALAVHCAVHSQPCCPRKCPGAGVAASSDATDHWFPRRD